MVSAWRGKAWAPVLIQVLFNKAELSFVVVDVARKLAESSSGSAMEMRFVCFWCLQMWDAEIGAGE